MLGRGTGNRIRFNTETDVVGGTTDEIQVQEMIDIFRPGEAVVARSQGGTETPGPTDGTTYYVGNDQTVTATGITLHTTKADAMNASGGLTSTPVNLTASTAGNGELWRIDKKIDTRPELLIVEDGTPGSFDIIGGSYDAFADITLTSASEINGATLTKMQSITTAQGLITDCVIADHTTLEGEGLIACNDLDDISGCSFDNTGGRGFAIESTDTASATLSNTTFAGYGGSTTITDHEFDATATGVDTTNNRITMDSGDVFATGDAVYYTRRLTANTIVTGLTEGTVYYVNRFAAGVYTLHLNEGDALNGNAAINLTVVGSGTHSLWSANAAIFFNHSATVTVTISGGDTPTICTALDAVVTISSNVIVTFSGMKDSTEVRVYAAGTSTELDGIENATAGTPDNRSFGASVAASTSVDYVIHNVNYEYIRVEGFTWPTTAQTIQINQRLDRNFENPP
jgi:hypothetical protein